MMVHIPISICNVNLEIGNFAMKVHVAVGLHTFAKPS